MKYLPFFLMALFLVAFTVGCTKDTNQEIDTPEITEDEVASDIDSTLIDEEETVEIGSIV